MFLTFLLPSLFPLLQPPIQPVFAFSSLFLLDFFLFHSLIRYSLFSSFENGNLSFTKSLAWFLVWTSFHTVHIGGNDSDFIYFHVHHLSAETHTIWRWCCSTFFFIRVCLFFMFWSSCQYCKSWSNNTSNI